MKKQIVTILALAAMTISCKEKQNSENEVADETSMTTTTEESQDSEWTTLFDGEDMDQWHSYNGDSISSQWQIEGDALVLTPAEGREHAENLVSNEDYTDFILSLDWKISEAGNSGIMWGVKEDEKYHEPYLTGPEIQIIDNERHPDAKNGKSHQAGALYDMLPPTQDVAKPAGEWNTCVIKIDHANNEGSVTLNGVQVVEFPVEGNEWNTMVSNSKFADWEAFGKAQTGAIALQDHGNQVSFKNIKIKKL